MDIQAIIFDPLIESMKKQRTVAMEEIRIVFDGPPSHESGRFVEVENTEGASISIGEWHEREHGYWELRIPNVSKWQPIETAPKDNTVVLVCGGVFTWDQNMGDPIESKSVSMASYETGVFSANDEWWQGENSGGHDEYFLYQPTHWMPLPSTPVLKDST